MYGPNHTYFPRKIFVHKNEYGVYTINVGLASGRITRQDNPAAHISLGSVNNLIYHLFGWRRFIGSSAGLTIVDVYRGISDI